MSNNFKIKVVENDKYKNEMQNKFNKLELENKTLTLKNNDKELN